MFNDENTHGFGENTNENDENTGGFGENNDSGQSYNESNQTESGMNQGSNESDQTDNTSNQNDSDYNRNYNNSYYMNHNYYNDQFNNQSTGNNDEPPKNKKKIKSSVVITAVVVAAVILVAGVSITTGVIYRNLDSGVLNQITNNNTEAESKSTEKKYEDIGSTDTSNGTSSSSGSIMVTDVSGVVDGAMPSVVAITSKTLVESNDYENQIYNYFFGGGSGNNNNQYEEEAAGSGFIVDQTDTELLIVTNNHVVEGADSLKIQFDGQESEDSVDGYIKGTDSNADVAIVAVKLEDINNDTLNSIKKATLGDSDSVKVGEGVIAIGNALGYGQSVTTGVISAKDREANIDNKTMKLLQTDAAINGGNSGGALLNAKGEVIGINVAKYSSSGSMNSASIEGMGFAIPISSVKNIIGELETKETRTKVEEDKQGYLGIQGNDVPDDASEQYGIPKGAYVYAVTEDGPAAKAGIGTYDVITKFDGQTVDSMSSLYNMLQYYKAGEKVQVTVSYRDGREYKEKEVTVTLGDKSAISDLQNSKEKNQ